MRDRITELRRVPAGELRANPANWRRHPDAQRDALAAMLDEIGLVDAVIARETADGLELVDGHLRADLAADETVPVLVVDLDDAEAAKALATLDPIAALAVADVDKLRAVVDTLPAAPMDYSALYGTLDPVELLEPDPPDGDTARTNKNLAQFSGPRKSFVSVAGTVTPLDDAAAAWLGDDPAAALATAVACPDCGAPR